MLGSEYETPPPTKKRKIKKKRDKSIDQAISPLPQVQCISFDPETQYRMKEEKERSQKNDSAQELKCSNFQQRWNACNSQQLGIVPPKMCNTDCS